MSEERKGTIVGNLAYKDIDGTYIRCGAVIYYRDHNGFSPSARVRLDMVPIGALARNPNDWLVATFNPSDKIPEAPYIHGELFVPSDIRGDRTYAGKIITEEKEDGSSTHYRVTLDGVPLREYAKMIRQSLIATVESVVDENIQHGAERVKEAVRTEFKKAKKSLYLGVKM